MPTRARMRSASGHRFSASPKQDAAGVLRNLFISACSARLGVHGGRRDDVRRRGDLDRAIRSRLMGVRVLSPLPGRCVLGKLGRCTDAGSYLHRLLRQRSLNLALIAACGFGAASLLAVSGGVLAQAPLPDDDFEAARTARLCQRDPALAEYRPGAGKASERDQAVTDLHAAQISGETRDNLRLEGNVEIERADQRIEADAVDYDRGRDTVDAKGNVRYHDERLFVRGSRARSQLEAGTSQLDDVQYRMIGTGANGRAARAQVLDENRRRFFDVDYSTCPPQSRDWELRASRIDTDDARNLGQGRDLSLRFKGVPLLYLPYATFPLREERKTGLLYPQIGSGSDGGFDFTLPYYINLAPNYDATLYPRIISDRGLQLGGEFRYLWPGQQGLVTATFLPDDDEAGIDRHSYHVEHFGAFGPNYQLQVNLNRVSDDRFFEDLGDSFYTASTTLLPSYAYLRGRGEWWNFAVGGDDYQVTDPALTNAAEPYRRLPRATFDAEKYLTPWFVAGLRSEAAIFSKDDAVEGTRIDATPFVRLPIERSGWFVRPELAVRQTNYELDDQLNDTPSRTTPIASLDTGLLFERNVSWFGRNLRQTLEPRLFYLYVPFRDQDDIPLFDTQELTFSVGQLFRTNRFAGADRQADANQATFALSSSIYNAGDGDELVRATIGQIRYFEAQRVQLPGFALRDFSQSAYVGELDLSLDDRWRFAISQQWNPETDRTDLSSIRVQRRFGERSVANLSYRYRRDLIEQLDGSVAIPLNDRWHVVARWLYSLPEQRTLEAFGGLEYQSCCFAVRVLGRHFVRTFEGDSNNSIFFEIEFKGLGAFGRDSEEFLSRAILGYR